ncbi:lysine-2,3-aminomutase-like protein [Methylocella sp. CPCC 101449]|uniref:lysine-2,3-aminomutase-like protein n=1 Tax=Methylocella sp. CPCC 101449 TaxID=2987531 RepID=UPI0028907E93|nr:lysine-2,3-aminomutase-like protein [Methylocella sp. CPCC 101449]MDT2020691.1 lysine-2,3-aminomutase-like protein [Methylocella sp. CPCC 101449]
MDDTFGQASGLALTRTLRNAADLLDAHLIGPDRRDAVARVNEVYSIAITPDIAALIDPNDPNDPIARQFVPDARELDRLPQELDDPIGDEAHAPVEGIVHRYPDRVLLKLLHACPVYCRFCFRRESVGDGGSNILSPQALGAALGYIEATPDIWEVILTGGDPLFLSPRRLREVMQRLGAIAHVKIIRIHTRVPVADPSRVDDALIGALRASGKTVYVAVHANHPRELSETARAACARLVEAGIPLVSQSVLLRGVNDGIETLSALMRAFVENRIKPYYLHHPDLAPGTSHLRVDIATGQALMRALRGRVSGLCVPEYVLDIPGGHGKSPIGPRYLGDLPEGTRDGAVAVEDWQERRHVYVDASAKPHSTD